MNTETFLKFIAILLFGMVMLALNTLAGDNITKRISFYSMLLLFCYAAYFLVMS